MTYEDFPVGKTFTLPPRTVTKEEIIEFALEFDPQPFHIDENSNEAREIGGLIASGWHLCSILMRMMCDAYLLDSASQGSPGLEEVRWKSPVYSGDTISGTATVVDKRVSRSNPSVGLVTFEYSLINQHSKTVMTVRGPGIVDTKQGKAA